MSYAMRFNLSIAIVAMVKRSNSSVTPSSPTNTSYSFLTEHTHPQDNHTHLISTQLGPACPLPSPPSSSFFAIIPPPEEGGEFEWDEVQQGIILGSFFWGYVLTQLPGGIIAQRYGGKWPLGLGLLITAVFALLTPLAARTHVGFLIAARVIQGLGEVSGGIHRWSPVDYRPDKF